MFPVQPQTVQALFDAQTEPNRGRLRLDVSAQMCPADPTSDYEWPAAQVAVAERFLRSLAGYVDEVAVGWPDDDRHQDPRPVVVMSVQGSKQVEYPGPLGALLGRVFGLHDSRGAALQLLGLDFYHWLKGRESQQALDSLGIRLSRQGRSEEVEVMALPYERADRLLDETDARTPGPTAFVRNGKWQW